MPHYLNINDSHQNNKNLIQKLVQTHNYSNPKNTDEFKINQCYYFCMKKLLLILICLFVSFEVKSENQYLRGTKILCIFTWHNGDELVESELYGYEFVPKMKEDEFNFHKSKNTPDEGFLVYRHKDVLFRYYLDLLYNERWWNPTGSMSSFIQRKYGKKGIMGGGDFHPNNLGQRHFYEKAVKAMFEDDRLLEPFVPNQIKKKKDLI